MTQPTRRSVQPRMFDIHPHPLPISSAPSRSARVTESVTRGLPSIPTPSVTLVYETVSPVNNRREQQLQGPAAPHRTVTVAENVPVPPSVSPSVSEQPSQATLVAYEGTDEQCSIWLQTFKHDENVCRLPCRHMYHHQCYQDYSANSSSRSGSPSCPNCRGSGNVIALLRFINRDQMTQSVGGQIAEHLLDA